VPLRDAIEETGAADDTSIVDLARELLAAADPQGAQVGKYNVHVKDSQGTVIGDNAQVTQTFGTPPNS
jgi:nucleoside-triphosphatase THEP1